MNKLYVVIALVALLAAGALIGIAMQSAEEPSAPAPAAVTTEDDAAEAVVEEEVVEEAASETLEVVEESAAEEVETEDQPIVLARADEAVVAPDWQFKEGQHFQRMVPTQPTFGGADKIEVAEFFWYGCPHCFDMEPYVKRWLEDKPADVRFIYVPATWNRLVQIHARLFYTAEVLARNGDLKDPAGFRTAVFQEYHQRRNQLASEDAIRKLFERFGVSADAFEKSWKSFEVEQNLRKAADLARRYSIASVPQVVVNGKYRTGGQEAGGYSSLMDVIDELVERERLR